MKDLTLKRIGSVKSAIGRCEKSTWAYQYWSNILSYMVRVGEQEDMAKLYEYKKNFVLREC